MSATDLNNVLRITKKMKKMIKNNNVIPQELVRYFAFLKDVEMNLDILTKTGVGLVLNQLRRLTDDSEVDKAGKALIKSWRGLVPASNNSSSTPANSKSHEESPTEASDPSSSSTAYKKPRLESVGEDKRAASILMNRENTSSSFKIVRDCNPLVFRKNHETKDTVRLKSREMLQKALDCGEIPDGAFDVEYLAVEIEVALFKEFKEVDTKYRNRLRSRVMNLRDKANSQLRYNVLMGHISAERFAKMTAEEMASDEMKKMRDQFTQEAINEHQLAVQGGTETDLIKCRKCGQNRCTYTQLQTRSSDEPMTTFVFCSTCGHRFKFN